MAGDFYSNNDFDDNRSYRNTVALCVAAASLVVLVFLVVLYINSESRKPSKTVTENVENSSSAFTEDTHNFTSDELAFWDDVEDAEIMPDEEGEKTPYKKGDSDNSDKTTGKDNDKNDENSAEQSGNKDKDKDSDDSGEGSLSKDSEDNKDPDDENHIAITDEKGNKKYYEIISTLPKNQLDLENCLENNDGKLSYRDSRKSSVLGVDLSKYNGTIDWKRVKDDGISFAMLRLGSRGYVEGVISLDEKFVEYAQNAALNDIAIGAYFYSSAITEAEAIEEANYVVGAITSFNVKYPVAIDIEKVSGDESRTDKLNNKERTAIVKAFCDTVKSFGFKPVIYTDREMLITGLDLEELKDYDVWLSDTNVPTDYPYEFTMWQYTKTGTVDGISGDVDMDISMVRYEQR